MDDAIGNLIVIERSYDCETKTTRLLIPSGSVPVVWVVIIRYCRFSQLFFIFVHVQCPRIFFTVLPLTPEIQFIGIFRMKMEF